MGRREWLPVFKEKEFTEFLVEKTREKLALVLNLIYSSLETGSLLVFMATEVCHSDPPSKQNLLESVISRQPPDVATLGSTTAFNSKFMLFLGCSQPVTAQQGFCEPSAVEPDCFWPLWNSSKRRSLLWGSPLAWLGLSWATLESEPLLPNPSSFPFSFHKCQISIVLRRLFLPTTAPSVLHSDLFPQIHLSRF